MGGLFEDLPTVKKGANNNDEQKSNNDDDRKEARENNNKTTQISMNDKKKSTASNSLPTKKKKSKHSLFLFQPSQTATAKKNNKEKAASSISSSFVPASIQKRKRKSVSTSSSSVIVANNSKIEKYDEKLKSSDIVSSEVPKTMTTMTHDSKNKPINQNDKENNKNENESNQQNPHQQENKSEEKENESEELQKLHASVHRDSYYNPHIPNDYLVHLERKKNMRRQAELERATQKTLQMQQAMRQRIEEERKIAEQSGDYMEIARVRLKTSVAIGGGTTSGENNGAMISQKDIKGTNSAEGRGRGRGGVNNLPAWLLKKQREQQEEKLGSATISTRNDTNEDSKMKR